MILPSECALFSTCCVGAFFLLIGIAETHCRFTAEGSSSRVKGCELDVVVLKLVGLLWADLTGDRIILGVFPVDHSVFPPIGKTLPINAILSELLMSRRETYPSNRPSLTLLRFHLAIIMTQVPQSPKIP